MASIALALDELEAATLVELADALERREEPFVLVLDDLHHLRSPEAQAVVMAIADAVPHGSQVVAAGRREPDLPIGRLRAQGRLFDLRARDLVMTRREAVTMLSLVGLDLEPEDMLVLLERTEGWPAGLYLAALSLAADQDVHRAVARFGGDDRLLADYVRDELLGRLDAEQLALPRARRRCSTSCPARCATRSCVAAGPATCCATCRARTCSSSRSTTRTGPTAITRSSATCSRRSCVARDPQCEAELHRRASDWYARAGDADRAIDHAIDAGDAERAGELLWATAARVFDGRGAEVRRRLERFTPEQSSPPIRRSRSRPRPSTSRTASGT